MKKCHSRKRNIFIAIVGTLLFLLGYFIGEKTTTKPEPEEKTIYERIKELEE